MDIPSPLSLEFVERRRNRLEALRDQLRGEEEQASGCGAAELSAGVRFELPL
jgi:hypothetical protein